MPDFTPKEARLILDMLIDLFDDHRDGPELAAAWLITPCFALDNRIPISVIGEDEDGTQQVIQLIGRLREGIPL